MDWTLLTARTLWVEWRTARCLASRSRDRVTMAILHPTVITILSALWPSTGPFNEDRSSSSVKLPGPTREETLEPSIVQDATRLPAYALQPLLQGPSLLASQATAE